MPDLAAKPNIFARMSHFMKSIEISINKSSGEDYRDVSLNKLDLLLDKHNNTKEYAPLADLVSEIGKLERAINQACYDRRHALNSYDKLMAQLPYVERDNSVQHDVLRHCKDLASYLLTNINPPKSSKGALICNALFPKPMVSSKEILLEDVRLTTETVKLAKKIVSGIKTEETFAELEKHSATVATHLENEENNYKKNNKKKRIWGGILCSLGLLVLPAIFVAAIFAGVAVPGAALPVALGIAVLGVTTSISLITHGSRLLDGPDNARQQANLHKKVSALRRPGQSA